MLPLPVFALLACDDLLSQQPPLPEKIEGMWELHALEIRDGQVVDALPDLLKSYPGCTWGRRTWTFNADHIQAGLDLLCPAGPTGTVAAPVPGEPAEEGGRPQQEYFGCQVTVRVPAIWDTEAGLWKVAHRMKATSRTVGRDADAIGVPTSCSLELPAGDYAVARVPKQPWRWEMLTPEGVVYRLKLPDSDRPDFVAALRGQGGSPEQAPGAIGGGR